MAASLIFLIIALIFFLLEGFKLVVPRVSLGWLGLAAFVLYLLIARGTL